MAYLKSYYYPSGSIRLENNIVIRPGQGGMKYYTMKGNLFHEPGSLVLK